MRRDIGNFFELIYNYYKIVLPFVRKRIKLILFALIVAHSMLTVASASVSGREIDANISVSASCEGQKLTVVVTLPPSLCGFMGVLEYDSSAFAFSGASVSEESDLNLNYAEKDEKLVFLLDSSGSSDLSGETVSFFFDYIKEDDDMFAFSVYPVGDAYFFDGEELLPCKILPFGVAVRCKGDKTTPPPSSVKVDGSTVTDGKILTISCSAYGSSILFGGLHISVVDLEKHTVENFMLVDTLPPFSKTDIDSLTRKILFNISVPDGKATVIATPLVFDRRGGMRGERVVYYFSDRELIEY